MWKWEGLAKWRNSKIVTAHIGRKTTRAFGYFLSKILRFFRGGRREQMIWFRDANVKIIHSLLNFDLNSISTFQMMPWAPIFGCGWQSDINLEIDKDSKIARSHFPIRAHTHIIPIRKDQEQTIPFPYLERNILSICSYRRVKNLIKLATGFRIRAWLL